MLVDSNGIYRLDSLTLANAGINLSTIDPRYFQIFFRGQEQYVYVADKNGNNIFNKNDYIEFYGQRNDGSLDSVLYDGSLYKTPRVHQPNPYYSLFNDTSAYFLTWNNLTNNKRITLLAGDTIDPASPNITPYFMKQNIIDNHSTYYDGLFTSNNINFPWFDGAEGWAGAEFSYGSNNNFTATFNTSNLYSTPNANVAISFGVMGESNDQTFPNNDHIIEVKYHSSASGYTVIDNNTFTGYHLHDSTIYRPANTFSLTLTDVVITALSGGFSTSWNTVPYVTMKFPHTPNLENKNYFEIYVPQNSLQPQSLYNFTNDTISSACFYDLTDHNRVPITKNNSGVYTSYVPNSSTGEKFCVVKSENQFLHVLSIKPVGGTGSFVNYAAMAADSAFIIITNKNLMGSGPNDGVNAYKNYRASALGGSHNVIVADINDLYDEFGYGIPKFPFSIRHFVDYCFQNFPSPPQNLFLIGKSVEPDQTRNKFSDPTGQNYAITFVPSISVPTCDNMLVSGLRGTLLESPVPIGRLSAKSTAEVNTYLAKVKDYEHPMLSNPPSPDEWMKQAIFIAGGAGLSQYSQFCLDENNFAAIIEDTSFGGYGHVFCKNSSSPTQTSYADSLIGLINSGVSLISYFGHSAGNIFEFNIPLPSRCTNSNGRYPFFDVGGCDAGNIHLSPYAGDLSSSEIFTISNKGTIAFFADAGLGTVPEGEQLLTDLHHEIGNWLYGKSVGKQIQTAFKNVEGNANNPTGTNLMNATVLEMTLEGDPSVIIHSSKLPDYSVTSSSVYFTPSYVSTYQQSFMVNVIVTNLGKAINHPVKTVVKRFFPDGTTSSVSQTLSHIYYKDTLHIPMPVDPVHGPGLNNFSVYVDSGNVIPEIQYQNNSISQNDVSLMIYSGDIIPVYPYKYAIIPNNNVTLKANTANPFAAIATYSFQIDTTDKFNSPLLRTQTVKQSGSVVKWAPVHYPLRDSTVYYWRVRRDTSDYQHYRWRESSFEYIPNQRGWGQSHFFQFLKGDYFQYIDTNRLQRRFDFAKQNHNITVSTLNFTKKGRGNNLGFLISFSEDNIALNYWSYLCAINPTPTHVLVSVIDPITGNVWSNSGNGDYGSYFIGPLSPPIKSFFFKTGTPAEQEILRRFLQDTIPCGSKVILYTCDNNNLGDLLGGNSPNTNPGLVQAFQSIGGTQFPNIQNNLPYILIGRKCGHAIEKIAGSDTSMIVLSDTFGVRRSNGIIFSETVGPASKWNSFHWKYLSDAYDTMTVSIVGIRNNGTTDTLMRNITKNTWDIYGLNTTINADSFPNLQLLGYAKDRTKKTPPQLKKWQLYYVGVPEVSLNPVKHYSFHNPTLQQGDSVKLSIAVENIGDYTVDSLWFDSWILDANRHTFPSPPSPHISKQLVKFSKPLLVDSFAIATTTFVTTSLPQGVNSVWIEANGYNSNSHHQPEEYHFNNIGTVPFTLNVDKINPLLDVTFDGVHIMNGDIVSAKPDILITVKDENTFLALNDPSAFNIYLKRPNKSTYDTLQFNSTSQLTFQPAVLPKNSCKIIYLPALTVDGTYQLQVQAKDRSGNVSGSNTYQISFEVINKPSITNVLNYPNPFSTSTRFVFTLTGSAVPDYFKIQIMTITGKIVKEIDKFEMGPLHIGKNITDYAWDGKDMFGDRLAIGVYLYRVVTQLNGKSLDHFDSNADSFFTQGFGKMYLIR